MNASNTQRRHAELVSASIAQLRAAVRADGWILKQVQDDGLGERLALHIGQREAEAVRHARIGEALVSD